MNASLPSPTLDSGDVYSGSYVARREGGNAEN